MVVPDENFACLSLKTVERAALTFAEQLDLAHKGLCAWKNNPCAETLAYFPPTPVADLRGAYNDRCEALLKLSALPVISETAKQQMRLSRGAQLDQLLSERSPKDPAFLHAHGVGGSVNEDDYFAVNKGFYEVSNFVPSHSYIRIIRRALHVECTLSEDT